MDVLNTVYTDEVTSNWLVRVHENLVNFSKNKEKFQMIKIHYDYENL